MKGVVADTSEWIEYLAGRPAQIFEQCLETQSIVVPPIVITELTTGARSREERMVLEDLLVDLTMHESSFLHWARVGELRQTLRGKGLSVGASDAHIAQCALDRDAPLLARDAVFWKIAALTKLRLAAVG
jgi:predicted nucleic acid-binding protein